MKKMISPYRNLPAEHCGSGAMRNLLFHYCSLELEEEVIFGLGSGLDLLTIEYPNMEPPFFMSGRSITMEADVCAVLGIDYREQPEFDDAAAWRHVREEVLAGRPTMLSGDIFYLDYRDFKVHFPAHRFVLVGFCDETQTAWVADRIDPEPQACSLKALAQSRNPREGITTFNLWGKFFDPTVTRSIEDACRMAVTTSVNRMTGQDGSQVDLLSSVMVNAELASGMNGLSQFGQWMKTLPEHENAQEMASYFSRTIEKFGTGGGLFRKFYARFLEWAHHLIPDVVGNECAGICRKSAARWTALAGIFDRIAESSPDRSLWKKAGDEIKAIAELEAYLFTELLSR